jgi:diadenosine tetraphosphate (Ap4A) HIT family hydrolase
MLPKPFKKAMIYEDKKLYVCLANEPIAEGHVVVVWKNKVADLHLLTRKDFEYLMDKVDEIRNAMLIALKVEKVYLMYLDEVKQVHWHLIPRYKIKGFKNLTRKPGKIKNFLLADKIKDSLVIKK